MAEGTRTKSLEEAFKKLEAQFMTESIASRQRGDEALMKLDEFQKQNEEDRNRVAEKQSELELKIDNFQLKNTERFETLTTFMRNISRDLEAIHGKGSSSADFRSSQSPHRNSASIPIPADKIPVPVHQDSGRQEQTREFNHCTPQSGGNFRFPKLDFPSFDGNKPRSWIRKCEKYFKIFRTESDQRVELAMMHMNGRADVWSQGFHIQHLESDWQNFCEAVCVRFGERQGADIVEEFNKLKQGDDLDEYTEQFEELKASMIAYNPYLEESYFVASYISGLREEIRSLVKLNRPGTLAEVFEHASLHQEAVQAIIKLSKPSWKSSSETSSSYRPSSFPNRAPISSAPFKPNGAASSVSSTGSVNQAKIAPMPSSVPEQKRTPGLCYRCGDKYFVGHRCKQQSLHSLVSDEIPEVSVPDMDMPDCAQDFELVQEEETAVYVHTLTGSNPLSTIRIKGVAKALTITILIDSGSTHSFLDARVAKEAGFPLHSAALMSVAVANGNRMSSNQVCKHFSWSMQGYRFSFDMRILHLGDCDMVLGVDWLKKFSPLSFDFNKLQLSFKKDNQLITLIGFREQAAVNLLSGSTLNKFLPKREPMYVTHLEHFFHMESSIQSVPGVIEQVLEQFPD